MRVSLAAGRLVTLERADTFADGIALRAASELTLAHIDAFVDDVVTVTDEEIAIAIVAGIVLRQLDTGQRKPPPYLPGPPQ